MYAKFIDENEIEEAPTYKNGISNYNLDIMVLKADGYLPLLVTEPMNMLQPIIKYRKLPDCIEAYYVEGYVEPPVYEPTYAEKRAAEYPEYTEYLDAQVKINSENPELISQGQMQLDKYYADCLAVKNKYPKE